MASIAEMDDGVIQVSWQGRLIACRIADVRRSITHAAFLYDDCPSTHVVTRFAQQLDTTCSVFSYVMTEKGWKLSHAAQKHPDIFMAALRMAYDRFHLSCCGSARLGRGVATATGLSDIDYTLIMHWPVGKPDLYSTLAVTGMQRLPLQHLFGNSWLDVVWIQFLCVSTENARSSGIGSGDSLSRSSARR